jgi:hypothetical protein
VREAKGNTKAGLGLMGRNEGRSRSNILTFFIVIHMPFIAASELPRSNVFTSADERFAIG